ncbi:MAG: TlpA family protein disulfide reductase [Planctomycetaceae bacterium]|nr:TlpA family protein disulfide reductase [Planctomycetales bacterium]MCB9938917.1 TlpA family protein disulfide reductase [Planctomycetaceae bacterium]
MSQSAFSDDMPTGDGAEYRDHPPRSFTRVIVIAVMGLFTILLVLALQPEKRFGQGDVHPAVGLPMGDFEFAPLVGDVPPVTLESVRGQVVLINFWGTWCGPCMMEFPHLVEMNDRLKGNDGFRFVPVSCGPGGVDLDLEQLQEMTEGYLAKLGTDLGVYSDPSGGARMGLMKAAQLPSFSFPTTVLLGRDGTIEGLWQGYRPGVEAEIEELIKNLLKT